MRNSAFDTAKRIYQENYSDASVVLLCGSYVRGDYTEKSDLDIVVLYKRLPNAYRESYLFEKWPVEAFVHDYETLRYFFEEVDRPSGIPSLMQMVVEGIAIPETNTMSSEAKELAAAVLSNGPAEWGADDIDRSRYTISDLLEDLNGAVDIFERQAIMIRLYDIVATHYFRSRQLWSSKGKWIPRRLQEEDPVFAERFLKEVHKSCAGGEVSGFVEVVREELARVGGDLFAGYRLEAPKSWRLKF